MKKILYVLALVAVLFGATACSGSLHDAEVMWVEKIVLEGLTDLAGSTMVVSGNFIPNATGDGFWAHGGSGTNIEGAKGVVNGEGTVVFEVNVITSEAELEFLGKTDEDGWSDAKRFGSRAYSEAGGNAKVANTFSGSTTAKIIFGRVGAGNVITWSVVDTIPAPAGGDSVFISAVELANVSGVTIDPSATNDVYFLNGWLPGNEWGSSTPNFADFVAGTARRTFAAPVEISDNIISVQIRMMVTPADFWDGAGNKPNNSASNSIANPKDGNTYVFSYDYSTNTVNLILVP